MPDKYDPDERFKVDIGDEEPEEALRRLLDKKHSARECPICHGPCLEADLAEDD